MRQIRETLRLHMQAGLSYSEVGRALKISKSVAAKYVSMARAADVDWGIAQDLSDEALEARLYRPAVPRASHQLVPDFAVVHQELKRAGVTLMLLWEEYAGNNPLAYKYTSLQHQIPRVRQDAAALDAPGAHRWREAVRGLRRLHRAHR